MKSRFDQVKIGLFLGIILPIITFVIVYLFHQDQMIFSEYIRSLHNIEVLPKLVSLCVIPNLGIFFLFIYKEHYYGARGVLAATFIWALIVVIIKFLI